MSSLFGPEPLKAAPFRYWGAKVRMAPWLVQRLPDHDHFVEVCAGSAAVLAMKPPVMAETVNDVYDEVTNFFRVLQDPDLASQMIDRCAFTPYSRREFREALRVAADAHPLERAFAFFVRMQMSVVPGRTGWSYSTSPAAAKKANKPGRWATMPEHLRRVAERFERVQIESLDAVDCIQRYDKPGVLLFIDPPYVDESRPTSTGSSSAYSHDSFDHQAMMDAIDALQDARVAIVHYPHEFYDDRAWSSVGDYVSHRNIPNGDGRDDKIERLYLR